MTVTNTTDNQSQKVLTGPDGGFSISLPPGTYRVDVEISGYKHTTQHDITLVAGPPQALNITLEAGPMSEVVELRGHAPNIQTVGGEVSLGVDTRTLKELPVIDRNYQQLVQLQTGITPPFPMGISPPPVIPNWAVPALPLVIDPDRNRFFSTNGQATWNNFWYADGVPNEEYFQGIANRVQPVETVQQFNIQTAIVPVPSGFVGGAYATAITPGGTNGFHGDLFEFYSGDALRARDFFQTPAIPKPRIVYNQFGAAGGGAISKDKTFLFGSYEGTYTNDGYTAKTTVPTSAMLTGDFSAVPGLRLWNPFTGTAGGIGRSLFTGNVIPGFLLSPTASAIASFFPAPNLPGFFNNFQDNAFFQNHQQKADGRLDHRFSDRLSAFLRYGYTNNSVFQNSPYGNVIGSSLNNHVTAQNAAIDAAYTFSGSMVTDIRIGFSRYQSGLRSSASATGVGTLLGLPLTTLPGINISGFSPLGTQANVPQKATDNNDSIVWTWGLHTGMHNLKWGLDARRIHADGFTDPLLNSQFGTNGTFNFTPGATLTPAGAAALGTFSVPYNSLASFLLGTPTSAGTQTFLETPTARQTLIAGWLGDSIQVMHHLSLEFGIRYNWFGAIQPRSAGAFMVFNPATNTFNFAGVGTSSSLWTSDKDVFDPRFGFAYRINDKTVVRGGYGIQHFQQPYALMGLMPTAFGTVIGSPSGFAVAGALTPTPLPVIPPTTRASGLINGTSAGNLPVSIIPNNPQQPYVQNYSFQVQREFYYGSMISLGYVGALGRQLPFNENLNAAFPGTGPAGQPFNTPLLGRTSDVLLFGNGVNSNYNSLQASLNKRFAKGFSFIAAYTYAKALGVTNNNNTILNPFNRSSNYGPLDFDRQSMLTIGHLFELPFGQHGGWQGWVLGGWQLNGIFTWATGTPLNITSDPITCACPGFTPSATLVGAPYVNANLQVMNPASFATPAFGTLGNVDRGAVRAPGFTNYDMSLFKNFKIHDRYNLQLRGEAFDIANTPHFAPPGNNINLPNFGQQYSTLTGTGRQLNVGARIMF